MSDIMLARARLRSLGRWVRKLPNGRYKVRGVWATVRAGDLVVIAAAFETMEGKNAT